MYKPVPNLDCHARRRRPALIGLGGAEEPASKPGDDSIDAYLAQETAKLSERVLDGAKTREEWEARRPRLRQEYFDMLGLWPLPEKTPLNAKITGTLERGDVVIEKLHFQSRPGLYVTGNLYRPKKVEGKLPAILYVCGHSDRGRDGNKTAYQDHGMWFASNGYVCLIIDTLQLGEIRGEHHGTYSIRAAGGGTRPATLRPASSAGTASAPSTISSSRPDVDPDRIGVTGISGGGAATFWIAAADERVKCAVPVSGMSDLECYVSEKVINSHCDCMFLYNTYGWEWTTIAALVAPRPLLFANSDADSIFPMDGNRRIIDRLRGCTRCTASRSWWTNTSARGGHDYRPDLRVAVFQWINKHLKHDDGAGQGRGHSSRSPATELRVFPEDKDIPRGRDQRQDRRDVRAAGGGEAAGGRGVCRVEKGVDDRLARAAVPCVPGADSGGGEPGDSVKGQVRYGLPSPLGGPLLTTEAPLRVMLTALANPGAGAERRPADRAEPRGRCDRQACRNGPKPYAGANTVRLLAPRGGDLRRMDEHVAAQLRRRADALLGRTVDEGRVWDVAATVRYLAEQDKGARTWRVIGRGQAGVIAAYAALFEPSIKEVIAVDPPASHMDGPYFLGVPARAGHAGRPGDAGADAADAGRGEGQGVRQDGADLQGGAGASGQSCIGEMNSPRHAPAENNPFFPRTNRPGCVYPSVRRDEPVRPTTGEPARGR